MTFPEWFVKVCKWIVGVMGAVVGALAIFFAVRWVVRASRLGKIEGAGQPWKPVPGEPSLIEVQTPQGAQRVELPEGIRAESVRAVVVSPSTTAVVEVLHETHDRRSRLPAAGSGPAG